jgi:hypothetical protein
MEIDGLDRTYDEALLALDADLGVDVELRRGGRSMDALNWTDLYAGSVLDADVGDHKRHIESVLTVSRER